MKPAIVVVTHSRIASLKRLLRSIEHSDYNYKDITLIISIDGGAPENIEILKIATDFKWNYGKKKIINHKSNLGLRRHIIECGNLTEIYNSIIMLEDDLFVSPFFYSYALEALSYYENKTQIAGISLYSYTINETAKRPFTPQKDGSDVYFMQLPSSWGQLWNVSQWNNFRDWYNSNEHELQNKYHLPDDILSWPNSSWKKYFSDYMVTCDKYFVYPQISLTTNFGDIGTHGKRKNSLTQVPLLSESKDFHFVDLINSSAIYDTYMELKPSIISKFNKRLSIYKYSVDLYGSKKCSTIETDWILTSKKCKNPLFSFSGEMKPHELSVIHDLNGTTFNFCKVDSLDSSTINLKKKYINMLYDYPFLTFHSGLIIIISKIIEKIRLLRNNFNS